MLLAKITFLVLFWTYHEVRMFHFLLHNLTSIILREFQWNLVQGFGTNSHCEVLQDKIIQLFLV